MIRKLKRKLIALAMSSFALVLLTVLAVINVLNLNQMVSDADETLQLILTNSGTFPTIRVLDGRNDHGRFLSPEAPYENRYFSVLLDADGEALKTDTNQIAAVNREAAVAYAQKALASGETQGQDGDYRYGMKTLESGETLIVFLDCGRSLSSFRSYLYTSVLLYVCALAVVFALLAIFSRRIVRPISESYEKQKQFITDAGHDIKTPLTIIDADAEVLAMEIGENEWVEDIKTQARQLATLTGELISLSRMEETGARRVMIDFPLSDVVGETAQSFQALAKAQGKELEIRIEPMISICGDEKALRQLTSILLDNALKYSLPGSVIRLTLEKAGRSVRLLVENACEPLKREQIAHLFDRFYRADTARTPEQGGYGIGLSIAKAVTQAHRGKITASSPDGKSLAMLVTLPAVKTPAPETPDEP